MKYPSKSKLRKVYTDDGGFFMMGRPVDEDGKPLRARRKDGHIRLLRETILQLPHCYQTPLRIAMIRMMGINKDSVKW